MSEKKGNTVQLKYDFNTVKETQIQLKKEGKWYRVTCRAFRSWDGPRRIVYYENGEPKPQKYTGPLYYYESNKRAKKQNKFKTVYLHEIDKPVFQPRPHERDWYFDILKQQQK
jgi:TPR repeat protein